MSENSSVLRVASQSGPSDHSQVVGDLLDLRVRRDQRVEARVERLERRVGLGGVGRQCHPPGGARRQGGEQTGPIPLAAHVRTPSAHEFASVAILNHPLNPRTSNCRLAQVRSRRSKGRVNNGRSRQWFGLGSVRFFRIRARRVGCVGQRNHGARPRPGVSSTRPPATSSSRARTMCLTALGLDLALVRTYNSQGQLTDDNGDNWRLGVHEGLPPPGHAERGRQHDHQGVR